jgi:hypothetical protein
VKSKVKPKKTNGKPANKLVFGLFSPWSVVASVLGAGAGYVYYLTLGCNIEGCAFISNPYLSILWGALLALILAEVIRIIAVNDAI